MTRTEECGARQCRGRGRMSNTGTLSLLRDLWGAGKLRRDTAAERRRDVRAQRVKTHKGYQPVVERLLRERQPATVLDAPCGSGWLRGALDFHCAVDGLDLFAEAPSGYR